MMTNSNSINPEHYLGYRSFVRYDNLTKLINEYYKGSDSDNIDLYIDLSSFISTVLTNPKNILDKKDDLFISAWAINLCAHYRYFFKTRYGVYARIFLIYSDLADNGSVYRTICPEYYKEIVSPMYLNILDMNSSILKTMCPYIPNVEMIRTKYDFGVKMLDIFSRENVKYPSMIISNDILASQLTDIDNICMLYPSKYKGEDKSYIISKNNCIYNYIYKFKRSTNITPMFKSPGLLPLILAASGYNKRGFKSIYSITQIVNGINKVVNDRMMMDSTLLVINREINLISSMYQNKGQYNQVIIDRYKTLNYWSQLQSYIYRNDFDIDPYNGMINLSNNQAIYEINDQLFKNYQLDILSL